MIIENGKLTVEFTIPEMNLLCIYEMSGRSTLISDLQTALSDVYEPEMIELFESLIEKLVHMSDDEYKLSTIHCQLLTDETEV